MILLVCGRSAMSLAAAEQLYRLGQAVDVVLMSDAHVSKLGDRISKFGTGLTSDLIGYPFDFPEPHAEPVAYAIQHGPVRKGKGGKAVRWGSQLPSKHNRHR